MPMLDKRWQIAPRLSAEADQALRGYPPILRQILYNRGLTDAEGAARFIKGTPPSCTDPFVLLGVAPAVARLEEAIQRGEPIAIYGDYDTDGVTATVLLVQTLRALGARAEGYIPNRFDEGYGLNNEALSHLHAQGVRLVVTVDCGVRSIPEAEHARQIGLELIITDHHQPAEELPPALAIINPKQAGDQYPEKELAGVGLAYKLACALLTRFPAASLHPDELLDLVALGTVADLAPLIGENRVLVKAGLQSIRRPHRQGLMSLIGASGLAPDKITATDIGFALGPRLNAAGRLESALAAYELLLTSDLQKAGELAQQLSNQNRARQELTRNIEALADQMVQEDGGEGLLIFTAHADFNRGVVGLVASHLTEKYYRPAIVAQLGEEYSRGSCRSIAEFHITQALDRCTDLLHHHGGHAAAAGFTVHNDNLPALKERLKGIAAEQLGTLDLRPTLSADVEIPLGELKPEILQWLEWLQPTGYGNPQAVFVSRRLKVADCRAVGKDCAHLKLTVSDGSIYYDAIAFRQGHWYSRMPRFIDLLYTFETNEFNGRTTLQLNVKDLKAAL